MAETLAEHPLSHWEALFADVDCCLETVADLAEIPDHPHIAARGQVKVTERSRNHWWKHSPVSESMAHRHGSGHLWSTVTRVPY